jgi:hypothetical protein
MFIHELARRSWHRSRRGVHRSTPASWRPGSGADSALVRFGQFVGRGSLDQPGTGEPRPSSHLAAERDIPSPSSAPTSTAANPDGRERNRCLRRGPVPGERLCRERVPRWVEAAARGGGISCRPKKMLERFAAADVSGMEFASRSDPVRSVPVRALQEGRTVARVPNAASSYGWV